jgi:hypothetical protein
LNPEAFNTIKMSPCPKCRVALRADVYPAMFRPRDIGSSGERLIADKEASCFYHATKKAEVACSSCGRFLCALCDVEFNDLHLCPQCLEKGRTKRKIKNLENTRTCHDTIALYLATIPMIFVWLTLLTAPIALYMSIRYWKATSSIIPRTKIRFIIAICLAVAQIVGWVLFFGNIIS